MIFRTGAIYSLFYSRWKNNRKIYAFMLYGGPGSTKIHALNLGARELGTVGRVRIANVVARLSKVPAARKWDGATLYRIFRTYLPAETAKCYRTYFGAFVSQAAVINYGLNDPREFSDEEMSQNNKPLFEAAGRDLFVKMMNLTTGRGVKMKAVEDRFAKPAERGQQGERPPTVQSPRTQAAVAQAQADAKKKKGGGGGGGQGGPEIKGYY